MKDDPVPPQDHISRYCGGSSLENGEPTGASFQLKDGEEYLSVNWLELLQQPNREAEINEVREVLASKLTVGTTAKIAVLNVGAVIDHVQNESPDNRVLPVLHRPDEPPIPPDPSHSGIFDTRTDEQMVAELIAQVVLETYSAK